MNKSPWCIFAFLGLLAIPCISFAQPGSLDISFNPGTGPNEVVWAVSAAADGKILIAGWFRSVNGTSRSYIARLQGDGALDPTFDPGDGPSLGVMSLAEQSDQKVVIAGTFDSVNGYSRRRVARLRADGSLDLSFDPGSGAAGDVNAVLLQVNGQVLIAGAFGQFNGTNRNSVARLYTNGSLDLSFDPGIGINGTIVCSALQANGQIIIGGSFTAVSGTNCNYIARLNRDGTFDPSFIPDPIIGGDHYVRCTLVQADGKVIIGGSFTTVNGYTRHNIARLNADGTLDVTFNAGIIQNSAVWGMALQPDNKIVIAGSFTAVNGIPRYRVARLNSNGSLDSGFNQWSGANGDIYALAMQPDGKTLVAGQFSFFDGTNISHIARLTGDATKSPDLQFASPNLYWGAYLIGIVSNTYRVEWTTDLDTLSLWTPLSNVTLKASPEFFLDPTPAAYRRFYRTLALPGSQ